jgi:hypothetical protein
VKIPNDWPSARRSYGTPEGVPFRCADGVYVTLERVPFRVEMAFYVTPEASPFAEIAFMQCRKACASLWVSYIL